MATYIKIIMMEIIIQKIIEIIDDNNEVDLQGM